MKLLKITLLLFFVSCSHHHKGTGHHHHQNGSPFKIDHGGKTYYFDSELEKEEFTESIKKELQNPKCERRGRTLFGPEQK